MLAQDGKAGLSVTAFLLSKINAHKGSVTIKNNNLRTEGAIYLYLPNPFAEFCIWILCQQDIPDSFHTVSKYFLFLLFYFRNGKEIFALKGCLNFIHSCCGFECFPSE